MRTIIFLLFFICTEAYRSQRDYDLQTKQDQCRQDRYENQNCGNQYSNNQCSSKQYNCHQNQCDPTPCNFNNPKCLQDVVLYGIVCDCPIGSIKIYTQDGFFICTTGGFACNGTFPYCCNPGFHMDPVTRRCVLNPNPPPCIPCRNGTNANCTGLCINGINGTSGINGTDGTNGTCPSTCINGTNCDLFVIEPGGICSNGGFNITCGFNSTIMCFPFNGTDCFRTIIDTGDLCENGGINITCGDNTTTICFPGQGCTQELIPSGPICTNGGTNITCGNISSIICNATCDCNNTLIPGASMLFLDMDVPLDSTENITSLGGGVNFFLPEWNDIDTLTSTGGAYLVTLYMNINYTSPLPCNNTISYVTNNSPVYSFTSVLPGGLTMTRLMFMPIPGTTLRFTVTNGDCADSLMIYNIVGNIIKLYQI